MTNKRIDDMVPYSTRILSSGTMATMSSRIYRSDLLAGKTALITGGATGIGAAIAREFGHLGANVVIASRKPERIAAAAEGLSQEFGRPVHGIPCDIRDRDAVAALVQGALDHTGRIDILVNNGGGQFFAPAATISPRGWDAVVGTNLTGTWNLTQAAATGWMLEHGGRIINITMNNNTNIINSSSNNKILIIIVVVVVVVINNTMTDVFPSASLPHDSSMITTT